MEEKNVRIESYFEKYQDVPREVILKESLLREGFWITKAARDASKDKLNKSFILFSYIKSGWDELKDDAASLPEEIKIMGGQYNLRRTIVRTTLSKESQYVVDMLDGELTLTEYGKSIAKVSYTARPKYYDLSFEDGTPYSHIIPLRGGGRIAFINAYRVCQYWGPNEECKFCDINNNLRKLKQYDPAKATDAILNVEKMATVAKAMYDDLLPGYDDLKLNMFFITGGTITKTVKGMDEDEYYLRYVTAVRERTGFRTPLVIMTSAKTKEQIKRYKDAGISAHHANMEVWDKDLFKIVCPGKEGFVGRDEWVKRVIDSVEILGEGNAAPKFVAGTEMAQPWGFKDYRDAVKSLTEGLDYYMKHGVTAGLLNWCVEEGSDLKGHPNPPLDFFIQMDINWYELFKKYDLVPILGWGSLGPGRATNNNSAYMDMGT